MNLPSKKVKTTIRYTFLSALLMLALVGVESIYTNPSNNISDFFDFKENGDSSFQLGFYSSFISGLVLLLIGWLIRGEVFKYRVNSLPQKYVNELHQIIKDALKEGDANIKVHCIALVNRRNDIRNRTQAIYNLLNSDIDKIEEILKSNHLNSNKDLFVLIKALSITWKGKKKNLKPEIESLLFGLGIYKV